MNDDGFNIAALLSFSLSESLPQSSSYILSLLVPALNRKLFDVYTVKSSNQRLRIFLMAAQILPQIEIFYMVSSC